MKVFQLNAYFSILFIFWCLFMIYMTTHYYEIIGSSVKLIQGLYLIVAFAVYRNYWAYKNEAYAKKCFPISIGGFAAVSIAQICICLYCAGLVWEPSRSSEVAESTLILLIPSLPLGLFGFALSFYCNLKATVPYLFYKRVEYFALFPIYAVSALSLSCSIFYWIAITRDVIHENEVIATHSSIVFGSFLIIIGFISFKKEIFFVAFCSLSFAAFNYIKIVYLLSYEYLIQGIRSTNLKGDYYFLLFHLITVLIMIFVGILMSFYASRPFHPHQKSSTKHKIYVAPKEMLPFTITANVTIEATSIWSEKVIGLEKKKKFVDECNNNKIRKYP